MWTLAVLMLVLAFSARSMPTGGTRSYELGGVYKYVYDAAVLVNGVESIEDGLPAGKPVGFRVEADLKVTNVWELGSELLLQISASNFQTYTSSGKEHAYNFLKIRSDLEKAKLRTFLHLKDGVAISAYMDKDLKSLSANVARGYMSLFQFATFSEKRDEVDVSGKCNVVYARQNTGYHVTKTKVHCRPERDNKDYHRAQKVFGIDHDVKSVIDYKFAADAAVIDSLKSEEFQTVRLTIRNQAGNQIYSNQSLTLKETTGDGKTVKGSAVTVAIAALESRYKMELVNRGLEVEEVARKSVLVNTPNLKKLIASKRKDLASDKLGQEEAAKVYLKLVEVIRISAKDAIAACLKDKNNAEILPQIVDAMAGAQTVDSHSAVMEYLGFDKESDLPLVERYLMVLSLATNIHEDIVKDLLSRAEKGVKIEKAAKSLDLALAAVTHILSLHPAKKDSKVIKQVEEYITSKLSKCTDDECRSTQLRSFANLKSETTLPSLIQFVKKGGKIATVALQSIKSFSSEAYRKYGQLFESVYLRLGKPYDNSARTIAFDLVLKSELSDEFLETVIGQLGRSGDTELKKYAWSKLMDKTEKCELFSAKLANLVRKVGKNHYNAMAVGGLSTVFTRVFHSDKSGESGFVESMEIGSGLLKRSAFDVYLKNNQSDFDLLSLNLFAGGLSSLAGTASDDGEAEEEDATAGMELTLGGAYLRPIVFFTGQTELFGHVWSGTASERTTVLQASSLLFDHRQVIPVQVGIAASYHLYGSISFDFAGQVQISLWYKTCHSLVENRAGLAISSVLALDTVGLSSDVRLNLAAQAQLDFTSDATFSGDVKLCLKMTQPDFRFRHSLSKAARTDDEKHRVSIRWNRVSSVPGRSFVLNRKNSELCSEMFGNS